MGRSMRLYISSAGEPEINARMERLIGNLTETRMVMEQIGALILAGQKAAFGRGKPLSPYTLADKAARGYPKTKLVRTGVLRESLTTPDGGEKGIRLITSSTLVFGTEAWYGIFSKSGTKSGEPKRFTIGISPTNRKAIRFIVFEHLGWAV